MHCAFTYFSLFFFFIRIYSLFLYSLMCCSALTFHHRRVSRFSPPMYMYSCLFRLAKIRRENEQSNSLDGHTWSQLRAHNITKRRRFNYKYSSERKSCNQTGLLTTFSTIIATAALFAVLNNTPYTLLVVSWTITKERVCQPNVLLARKLIDANNQQRWSDLLRIRLDFDDRDFLDGFEITH